MRHFTCITAHLFSGRRRVGAELIHSSHLHRGSWWVQAKGWSSHYQDGCYLQFEISWRQFSIKWVNVSKIESWRVWSFQSFLTVSKGRRVCYHFKSPQLWQLDIRLSQTPCTTESLRQDTVWVERHPTLRIFGPSVRIAQTFWATTLSNEG